MKTLFDFATGELTGSGFWAWILSALCEKPNDKNSTRYRLASNYVAKMGLDVDAVNCFAVKTEVKMGKAGRADIVLYQDNYEEGKPLDNIALIIENKTWSTPCAKTIVKQVNDYWNIAKLHSPSAKRAVMTFRYDTEEMWKWLDGDSKKITFLGLDEQCQLFDKKIFNDSNEANNEIIRHYKKYLFEIQNSREQKLEKIKSTPSLSGLNKLRALNRHDTQWSLMTAFTKDLSPKVELYNGNSSGRPWTQAGFDLSFNGNKERFFYRLDADSKGYYLRLNHYSKNGNEQKDKDKRNSFRQAIKPLCEASLPDCGVKMQRGSAYQTGYEYSFWYIRFEGGAITKVPELTKFLNRFHTAFTQ